MSIKAQLPDGTTLEFEDGTPDDVIDRVVKQQLGVEPSQPAAPAMDDAEKRKAYEAEVADYMKRSISEKSFDPQTLQGLASKYGMSVSNLPQIEEFYKKSGMLSPRVAYQDPTAPVAPPAKPLTEISPAGEGANRVRAFAKGALFDFADEAEAAARMLASGEISSDEYYKIKNQIDYDYNQWAKANPKEALGLELSGGVAGTFIPGAGLIGRGYQAATGIGKIGSAALRSAAVGASAGALSGAGAADTISDIPSEVIEQGIIGGGVSALLPGAGRLALSGRDALMRRLGRAGAAPDRVTVAAAEQVQKALGPTSPERAGAIMQLGQRYGVPTELGMATPELARLTKAVLSKPSEGREALARTLAERQSEAPQRYAEAVREAFPGADDYFAAEDAITERLRSIGENEYQAAFAVGQVKDPTIQNILKAPGLEDVFKDAQEIAKLSAANAASRGENPAEYALKMQMEPVLDEAGALVGMRPTGDVIPDVRSLNYVKRALDSKIDQLFRSGQGEKATQLKGLRDNMVRRLDQIVPEYREARKLYAGDLEVRDAMRTGREALSRGVRPQQVQKAFSQMSDAEKEAYRTGVMQKILEPTEDVARSRNFAKDMRSPANLAKLRTILPKGQFRVLDAALKRESELFERTSKTLGGSPTTPLAQDIAALDTAIASGDLDTAVGLILNPTSPGNLARFGIWLSTKVPGSGMTEKVYTKLAQALRVSDPNKLKGVLQEYRAAQEIAARNLKADEALAGRGAVALGSAIPAAVEERSSEMPPSVQIGDPDQESIEETIRKSREALSAPIPGEEEFVQPEVAEEGEGPFDKASVGIRNNNPGNLIVSAWTKKLPGYLGPGEGVNEQGIPFAKFDTMAAGKNAKIKLVVNKIEKGYNTPRKLVESWLSPTNARNDPEGFQNYVNYVSQRSGVGPDEEISGSVIRKVGDAIYEFETGDRP